MIISSYDHTVFNLINCKHYFWTGADFAIKWLALNRFKLLAVVFDTPNPRKKRLRTGFDTRKSIKKAYAAGF